MERKKTEASYECLFCQQQFRTARALEVHISNHTGERPSVCNKCDASFKSSVSLRAHRKEVHMGRRQKLPLKKIECLFCHLKFRWNRDLESHMNTHTRERPYNCNKCDATFSNYSTLYVHNKCRHTKLNRKRKRRRKIITLRKPKACSNNVSSITEIRNKLLGWKPERIQNTSVKLESDDTDEAVYIKENNTDNPFVKLEVTVNLNAQKVQMRSCQSSAEHQEKKPTNESNLASPINISSIKQHRQNGIRGDRRIRMVKHDKRKENGFEENTTVKSRIGCEEQNKYDGNACISLQSDMSVHPLQFPISSHLLVSNGFAYHHEDNDNNQKWDASFFLHMNRYNPKDSCFSKTYSETKLPESKRTKRNANVTTAKNRKIVQIKKRGRPRKNSDEAENFTNSSIRPTELKKIVPSEIQRVGNGYVKCPYCPKTLFYCNLTAHLLTHTGEKPFACAFCEFRFRQKSHMIKHIVRYHRYRCNIQKPGSKRPPVTCAQDLPFVTREQDNFSCPFCGESSKDGVLLEQHLLRKHNDKFKNEST